MVAHCLDRRWKIHVGNGWPLGASLLMQLATSSRKNVCMLLPFSISRDVQGARGVRNRWESKIFRVPPLRFLCWGLKSVGRGGVEPPDPPPHCVHLWSWRCLRCVVIWWECRLGAGLLFGNGLSERSSVPDPMQWRWGGGAVRLDKGVSAQWQFWLG